MAKSQKKKAKYFGDVKDAILSPKDGPGAPATISMHMTPDQFQNEFFPAMVELSGFLRRNTHLSRVMLTGHRASGRCRRNRITVLVK